MGRWGGDLELEGCVRYARKTPSSCRAFRTEIISGSLIINKEIVTLPIAVSAFNSGPSQTKCSAQVSLLGWNKRMILPLPGYAGDVRTLESGAMDTSEGEIVSGCCSTVLDGNDVIDLEGCWMVRRRQLTILTTGLCPVPHEADEVCVQFPDDRSRFAGRAGLWTA